MHMPLARRRPPAERFSQRPLPLPLPLPVPRPRPHHRRRQQRQQSELHDGLLSGERGEGGLERADGLLLLATAVVVTFRLLLASRPGFAAAIPFAGVDVVATAHPRLARGRDEQVAEDCRAGGIGNAVEERGAEVVRGR